MTVRLGEHARLLVPAEMRRKLGLRQGDPVCLDLSPEGDLRVLSLEKRLTRAKGLFRKYREAGDSVADELVDRFLVVDRLGGIGYAGVTLRGR